MRKVTETIIVKFSASEIVVRCLLGCQINDERINHIKEEDVSRIVLKLSSQFFIPIASD